MYCHHRQCTVNRQQAAGQLHGKWSGLIIPRLQCCCLSWWSVEADDAADDVTASQCIQRPHIEALWHLAVLQDVSQQLRIGLLPKVVQRARNAQPMQLSIGLLKGMRLLLPLLMYHAMMLLPMAASRAYHLLLLLLLLAAAGSGL
ncbi:hypothetical protein COO60DRAFT_1519453, partial [Scenedesmus sp. NREL 46B-D3]